MSTSDKAMQTTLERIARETLNLETLETRKMDGLDFHDLAVWQVHKALEQAYAAGQAAAARPNTK